jgi:acyl-CoA thioester hydrolase
VPREFRYRRRVQFYETDAAGIVHFSWFFRYMEEAEHAFWRSMALSVEPPDADIGWPRVAASFDFERPLRFEDEFDVSLRVVAMTASTIRYACILSRGDERIGHGSLTAVCVGKRPGEPMQAVEIPPDLVSGLRSASGLDR